MRWGNYVKDGVHLFVLVDTMSEKSAEVVPDLIVRRGLNGRCTYSVAAKRALAQLCKRPGVSVAKTALSHGVNANLLRKWMNQFGESQTNAAQSVASKLRGAVLLPVSTSSTARALMSTPSFIELEFAATRIRVHGAVDARALGVVLDCLAQRA